MIAALTFEQLELFGDVLLAVMVVVIVGVVLALAIDEVLRRRS